MNANHADRSSSRNIRGIVLEMLMLITAQEEFSHIVIKNVLDKYDYLEQRDRAFMKHLCEGTIERTITLDYVINLYSNVPVNKCKPLIRNLLRMSVYQLLYMNQVPESAVCNEAVKIAKKKNFTSLAGFVNGVLRSIARNRDNIVYPSVAEQGLYAISVKHSMPEWILALWNESYSTEKVEAMAEAMTGVIPITVCVKQGYTEEFEKNPEKYWTKHPLLPFAYYLQGGSKIQDLHGYQEGIFHVQDTSSMLSVMASGVKEGDLAIDVCASPGGKMLLASQLMKGSGKISARDLSQKKVQRILENAQRMGVSGEQLEVLVWDATEFRPEDVASADVVFADLPCSGLGIMGKKKDIRYRMSQSQMEDIVALQRAILEVIQQYVKPGGILMYSTCTIHRKENEEQREWILEHFPYEEDSLDPFLPAVLQSEQTKQGYLQLTPDCYDTDGFFMARLRRKDSL